LQGLRRHFALFCLLLAAVALQADDHAELLNQEEREWLRSLSEPIIVGTEANYRPYAYLNDEGEFDGVAADYLRLIEDKLGISFVVHEFESFAGMLDAAEKQYIDIVPFALAAPERASYLDFTQPFFEVRDRQARARHLARFTDCHHDR